MPRFLVAILLSLPLLSGCTYLVSGMQKNMENDGRAISTCMKHEMTLQAQQVTYKRTVSGLLAKRIGFPPDGTFDDTSKSVSAILARAEDRFKSIYADFLQELDDLRNDDATQERIRELEAEIQVIEGEIKDLGEHASEMRELGRGIADTLKAQFDALEGGLVHYTRYGPSILIAASKVRSDVATLQVEFAKLNPAIDSILTKITAILDKDRYKDIEGLKKLKAAIEKFETDIHAPIKEALESAKLILLGLRNGISFDEFLTEYDRELLKDALDVVIRFKVAKIAVGRLEKGIYIIEAKLNQVDEKIWVLVSLAQITLTNGIREALSKTVEEAFESGTNSQNRTDSQTNFQNLARAYIDEKTYDNDKAEDESADQAVRKAKGKLEDYWLWPLTTAACERLMVNKDDPSLNTARTDQLLAPLYWALVEKFDQRVKEQSEDAEKFVTAKINEFYASDGGRPLHASIRTKAALVAQERLVESLRPVTTNFAANPIGQNPMTSADFKKRVADKIKELKTAPEDKQLIALFSNAEFEKLAPGLVLKLVYLPSSIKIGDFDKLDERIRATPFALERNYVICRLAWRTDKHSKLVARKLDLHDAGIRLSESDEKLITDEKGCAAILAG